MGTDQEIEQNYAWVMVVTARGIELPDHKLSWIEQGFLGEDTLHKKIVESVKKLEQLNIKKYYEEYKIIIDPMAILNDYQFILESGIYKESRGPLQFKNDYQSKWIYGGKHRFKQYGFSNL